MQRARSPRTAIPVNEQRTIPDDQARTDTPGVYTSSSSPPSITPMSKWSSGVPTAPPVKTSPSPSKNSFLTGDTTFFFGVDLVTRPVLTPVYHISLRPAPDRDIRFTIALLGRARHALLLRRAVNPASGRRVSAGGGLGDELFRLLFWLAKEVLDSVVGRLGSEDPSDLFAIDLEYVSGVRKGSVLAWDVPVSQMRR
jgi:hypothetical protein